MTKRKVSKAPKLPKLIPKNIAPKSNTITTILTILIMLAFLVILVNLARMSFRNNLFGLGSRQSVNLRVGDDGDGVPTPPLKNVNINTRGDPGQYSQIGILSADGEVLPLFGRKTYASSTRYNYYTMSSDHTAVQIPLEFNGDDCMDTQRGCAELMDGDTILVSELGKTYTVSIYNTKQLQYIPYYFG